jgi:hypothetical protein
MTISDVKGVWDSDSHRGVEFRSTKLAHCNKGKVSMLTAVSEFLNSSEAYLLLVHPEISQLNNATDELLSIYGWSHISLGPELSPRLSSEIPRRRPLLANRWVKSRFDALSPGPVLCTGIDLLFAPSLSLNPLRLFKDASRIARLLLTWPGTYCDDLLAYAVPDHAHYRTWRNPKVPIVCLTHDD